MTAFVSAGAAYLRRGARVASRCTHRRLVCATWSLREEEGEEGERRPRQRREARAHGETRRRDDSSWSQGRRDDSRWGQGRQDDSRWSQGRRDDSRWSQGRRDDSRWSQARRDDSRWGPARRDSRRATRAPADSEGETSVVREVRDSGDDVLYGVNPVLNAMQSGRREIRRVFLQQTSEASGRKRDNVAALERIRRAAEAVGATVAEVDKGMLNVLVGHRKHQGVAAQASALEYLPEHELSARDGVLVALDSVSDPHNVGAVLRSAHFLGADGVVVSARNCAPLGAATSKASAGAAEAVTAFATPSLPRLLRRLRGEGWRVVGLAADGAQRLQDVAQAPRTVLVVGGEGDGLRVLVRRECDVLAAIDGGGDGVVDSLNLSVAAAIALHHLLPR